jgi:hypothetical protein
MDLRNLSKNNTLAPINKKIMPRSSKEIKKISIESEKENTNFLHEAHHAAKYLRGTAPNTADFKKFITLLYKGLSYSTNNLKGPSV